MERTSMYDNNNTTQTGSDDVDPSFNKIRERVDRTVADIKNCLKWEPKAQPPWYRPPGHDNFRRQYRHLMWDVQDPAHRAYIRSRFVRLWKWLQDRYRHKKKGGYPDNLRDEYFEQGEARADLHHLGWGTARGQSWKCPPLPIEVAEFLRQHRGTTCWCAFFVSDPYKVPGLVPHVDDEDFPADLLPLIKKYTVLAARDPAAVVGFWLAHHMAFEHVLEPLVREAQARVDALNTARPTQDQVEERLPPPIPTRLIAPPLESVPQLTAPHVIERLPPAVAKENPVSAIERPSKPTANEIAPLAAQSFQPDEEKLSAEVLAHVSVIAGLVEREPPPQSPAPVGRSEIADNSLPLIEEGPPAASDVTLAVSGQDVQSPQLRLAAPAAAEEPTPRLRRDATNFAVTPEDRLIGLVIKYRVPVADVPLAPAHFRNPDLQYVWKRWVRLGLEVDQLDVDAIRARVDQWAKFAIWLIDVAAASDPNNPIDPENEIALLAEQMLSAPPTAPSIVKEFPPPAAVVVEKDAPSDKADSQALLPLDRAAPIDIEAQNLAAALDLVKAGFAIFPARVHWKDGRWKKNPIGSGWQIGTTDPERVRLLWRRHSSAVPGIALRRAGLVVIDADRHGGPDGVAAFDKLIAEHGGLPIGPITATAGGGFHYIFKQPDGKPLGNHDGVLHGQGINVRGCGGWIVGPGAVCPDGSMWRTADGSPSLIEAFRNGTVPTIPAWFVDIVRPPKRATRKKAPNTKQTETAEPSPSARPPQSRKAVTKREKAYARGTLKKIVEELAAMSPNTGRNEMTYRKAFALGTMIARGWIDAETVKTELFSACERNGLVAEGDDVLGAIERGINDGSAHPHEDLADRRTRGARQPRDSTKAWVNLLAIEIYRLLRVRPGGEYASEEAANDVVAAIERQGHITETLDGYAVGRLLDVTSEEWKAIGVMFGRHPSRFRPYDSTPEQIDEYLASVRDAKKPARAQAARERRAREKLAREQQPPTNGLVARRCTAIIAYTKRHPGKHHTGDLVHGLERAKAFDGLLTDQSRRNAIVELLRLAVAGKLPELTKFLIVTDETAKNRKPTFKIEYRK
jgi:hypothetical protein